MDLSVFNKYREYQSETEQQFNPNLATDNHRDPDIHLIGESIPSPESVNSSLTAAVGTSPSPARSDHSHNLPDPLTRNRFGITANGSSAAPAIYWTNDTTLGFYRWVFGSTVGLSITRGGVDWLSLSYTEVYSSKLFRTSSGFYVDSGVSLVGNRVKSTNYNIEINADGYYIHFANWLYASSFNNGLNGDIEITSGFIRVKPSQRKFKKKIKPLSVDTGFIIDNLNPVSFVFKKKKGTTESKEVAELREADIQYGFIAEEVAEVDKTLGLWGATEDGKDFEVVNWRKDYLLSVVVSEMQKLRKRVEVLEDQLHGKVPIDVK